MFGTLIKSYKFVTSALLLFTFFTPWYDQFGGGTLTGFGVIFGQYTFRGMVLYGAAPVLSIVTMYRILKGKHPGIFYLLSGIPVIYLWLWLNYQDTADYLWGVFYLGGKLSLFISIIIVITAFVTPTQIIEFIKNKVGKNANLKS
ncbi:hypothetical protein SFC65_19320 [Priestia filamentosa]|uniref:hypothetical protein n=1 Tax=Priestia filamentosa TaxID=1402861 RepID=UPI003982D55E